MLEDVRGLEQVFIGIVDRLSEKDEDLFTTRSRKDIFSPALTMWATLSQRTHGRKTLLGALEGMLEGEADGVISRNDNGKPGVHRNFSLHSGGLSRAQKRLPLSVVEKLSKVISECVIKEWTGDERWRGKRVVIFDGTVIALAHSQQNVKIYPPIRNQNGESYTPQLRCMCGHDLFTGVAIAPRFGAFRGDNAVSEQALLYEMLDDLPTQSLIIADRNMGMFPVAHESAKRGHEVLVRLTKSRAKCFGSSSAEYVAEEVEWKPHPKYIKAHPEHAEASVPGRFIKWTVKNKGSRPLALLFFTNSKASAEELVELYKQRERIENDIRALKYTLGLEMLRAKTPEMLTKELLLGIAAYNLVRAIIAKTAVKLAIPARRVSFTRATALIRIFGNQLRDASSKEESREIQERFLKAINQSKLPNRTRQRIEPRKIAYCRPRFPVMTESRTKERKNIRAVLKKFGHRGHLTTTTRQT